MHNAAARRPNIQGGVNSPNGVVDRGNSTDVPLASSGSFVGKWFDATPYSMVTVMVASDQDAKTNGLQMQFSADGKSAARTKSVSTSNGAHTLVHISKYFRVVYTNGTTLQANFTLQVIHHVFTSKELTSTLNQTITNDSDVQNVRAVIAASDPSGNYSNVAADQLGAIKVNIGSINQTAFGEVKTAAPVPRFQETFTYNINPRIFESTLVGTGTVTQANAMAVVSTGVTAGGEATMESKRSVRYRPGQGILARFTGLFTTGIADSTQIIGIGDTEDGFFFGYNEAVFGILHRSSASGSPVDTWVPQTSWNGDLGDGTQALPVMDWTKGNVFEVQFQYLGFGTIRFFVEEPVTGDFIQVHTIAYANSFTQPSLEDPTLPGHIYVDNGSNNTELVVKSGSMAIFVEGEVVITGLTNSVDHEQTSIGSTETNVITLRNRTNYASKINHHAIFPSLLSVSTISGTKPVTIRLTINATLGGSPTWVDVDTNTSIAEYTTLSTTLSNGNVVLTTSMGKEDAQIIDIEKITRFIKPGDTLTVSAFTGSGSVDVTAGLTFIDDI